MLDAFLPNTTLLRPLVRINCKDFFEGGNEKNLKAQAYDVVCNGYEVGGGSVRIHRPDIQKRMFQILGIDEVEVEKQFGFFLKALQYGTPPHLGVALGFDRIMMLVGPNGFHERCHCLSKK